MNYKSYSTKANTPQRMTRKRQRGIVFITNAKIGKARRKSRRLFRRQLEQGE
jgi:hypothetical protein